MGNRDYRPNIHRAPLLLPFSAIAQGNLTKRDVKEVKTNLALRMGLLCFVAGIVWAVFDFLMFLYMSFSTNWKIIAVYGEPILAGEIIAFGGCMIAIVIYLVARKIKYRPHAGLLCRIGANILLVCLAAQCLLCIYGDAKVGTTAGFDGLCSAIVMVAVLILIQPSYWVDAIVIDLTFSGILIALTYYCRTTYNMGAPEYYGIVAVFYPFACYMVCTVLFYAEVQHYCQTIMTERLHNTALYDELTQCKNRHALTEFLEKNQINEKWHNGKYLLILFDIDDFKLYNDQFSHPGGDYCLRTVCEGIRKAFPSPSLDFFRYGGDEFLLVFDVEDETESANIVAKIITTIRELNLIAPQGAPKKIVTISAGGATFPTMGPSAFEEHLKEVDTLLYKAKENGKDSGCIEGTFVPKE